MVLSISLSAGGHIQCFQNSAITNCAAINLDLHSSLWYVINSMVLMLVYTVCPLLLSQFWLTASSLHVFLISYFFAYLVTWQNDKYYDFNLLWCCILFLFLFSAWVSRCGSSWFQIHGDSPASAFSSAGTTRVCHHAQLVTVQISSGLCSLL